MKEEVKTAIAYLERVFGKKPTIENLLWFLAGFYDGQKIDLAELLSIVKSELTNEE